MGIEKGIDLIIVASGYSTRFHGFPKAFCKIGEEYNVLKTIRRFESFVDRKFIIVNPHTYNEYLDKLSGCELVEIKTGHGDAHSLLKGLKGIKETRGMNEKVIVCWGDAVFANDIPVKQFMAEIVSGWDDSAGFVCCAYDKKPYAWFDVEKEYIKKSYFKSSGQPIDEGLHDQSIFAFKNKEIIDYLDAYRQLLGISDFEDMNAGKQEMKLLLFFEEMYKRRKPMRYVLVDSGSVLSFNTEDELERIKQKLDS